MDNVFIERLCRSLREERLYLQAFETVSEAGAGLSKGITCSNAGRPGSTRGAHAPAEVYGAPAPPKWRYDHHLTLSVEPIPHDPVTALFGVSYVPSV